MIALLYIAAILAFGLLHRLRGSYLAERWFGMGLTMARLCLWSTGGALLCWLIGYTWYEALGIFAGLYVGSTFGQPGHLNMGRTRESGETEIDWSEWSSDVSAALLRGLHWSFYPGIVLLFTRDPTSALVVMLAGLLTPLAYELGWRTPSLCAELRRGPEWGEVYLGCVIGAAFAAGFLA